MYNLKIINIKFVLIYVSLWKSKTHSVKLSKKEGLSKYRMKIDVLKNMLAF